MDILFDEEEFWGRHKDWLSKQQGVLWATHIDILYFFGILVKILNIQKNSKIYAVCMQIYIINKILAFLKTL